MASGPGTLVASAPGEGEKKRHERGVNSGGGGVGGGGEEQRRGRVGRRKW